MTSDSRLILKFESYIVLINRLSIQSVVNRPGVWTLCTHLLHSHIIAFDIFFTFHIECNENETDLEIDLCLIPLTSSPADLFLGKNAAKTRNLPFSTFKLNLLITWSLKNKEINLAFLLE